MAELIRILVLRRWAFFIPFCLLATLVALLSHQIPRRYSATTRFERRENVVLKTLPGNTMIALVKDSEPTILRALRDVGLMEEVLDEIGLTRDFPRNEQGNLTKQGLDMRYALAARYAGGLTVQYRPFQSETRFTHIAITCAGRDPTNLAAVCNGLRDAYIRKARAQMTRKLKETQGYFIEQASQCQEHLRDLTRVKLTEDLRSAAFDLADPRSIASRIQTLENEKDILLRDLENLSVRRKAYQDSLERIRELATRSASAGGSAFPAQAAMYRSPAAIQLQSQIATIDEEIYRERQVNKKTPKHPDVQELHHKRMLLKRRLARQIELDTNVADNGLLTDSTPPNTGVITSDTWLAQIANREMEIKDLDNQIRQRQHTLELVEANLEDFEQKKAEVFDNFQKQQGVLASLESLRAEYKSHRAVVGQLETLLSADESERAVAFSVLKPARTPAVPSNPSAPIVLMVSLFLGVVAGACIVLLCEIFDHSFHTSRQVTRSLGLGVLESIDEIVTTADRARLFRRRVLIAPVVVLCMLATVTTSNAMAYLSLKHPSLHERLTVLPERAWDKLVRTEADGDGERLGSTALPVEPANTPAVPLDNVRLAGRSVVPLGDVPDLPNMSTLEDLNTLVRRIGGPAPWRTQQTTSPAKRP